MDRRNRLRIMTSNEIIDVAIRIYQVLGWTFLKLTIVPSLFCLAAFAFFFRYVWPQFFVTSSGTESGQMLELVSNTALTFFVAAPLFILGVSYTSVVVTQLVSEYMLGNAPSAIAADARGRALLPRLFWLNLREILIACGGVLIGLGLLALAGHLGNVTTETDATAAIVLVLAYIGFVVGGVGFLVVIVRHALAPAIMTLEGLGIVQSARRSASLLKSYGVHGSGGGTIWSVYALLILLCLLVGGGVSVSLGMFGYPESVRNLIADLPGAGLIVEALGLLPTFLVLWTLVPVWAATSTIVYYDRRIRLEGYDIEALAEDVWRADRSRRFEL